MSSFLLGELKEVVRGTSSAAVSRADPNPRLRIRRHGKEVESWLDSFRDLSRNEVLWLDLVDPSADEEREVREALELGDRAGSTLADPEKTAALEQQEGYLRVTAVAVSDAERDPDLERIVVDCLVGPNWVLTARNGEIAVLDDFREVATGKGEIGILDAPSFLSALLEWVVTGYLRAFDEIEETLEEFDVEALASPPRVGSSRLPSIASYATSKDGPGRVAAWRHCHSERC